MSEMLKQKAIVIANAFTKWNLWRGGGGGGGSLSELSDVEITSPQLADILQYNGDKWENAQLKEVKVNKSYSTTERVIGNWIDGRPIYEKVFHFASGVNLSTSWTLTSFILSNDSKILYSHIKTASGTVSTDAYNFNGVYVRTLNTNQISDNDYYFILQYVKANDTTTTPVANVLHNYSTGDQIVGTWLDGKKIHERVLEVNFNLPSQTWGFFTMSDTIETAINGSIIDVNNNYYPCVVSKDKGVMQFRNTTIDVRKIVIQYTKP